MNFKIHYLLIFLIVLISSGSRAQFVSGNLVYRQYDYKPMELVEVGFQGVWVTTPIDSLNGSDIKRLLNRVGIPDSLIIDCRAFGSSNPDLVEIFFAYSGKLPTRTVDLAIRNKHHLYASYAVNQGIIMPAYSKIKAGLDSVAIKVATRDTVKSFMIKNYSMPMFPMLVLLKQPQNGTLADMRNIPGSYNYVDYFKDLNFEIIWYMDPSGFQKSLFRPKGGWPKKFIKA